MGKKLSSLLIAFPLIFLILNFTPIIAEGDGPGHRINGIWADGGLGYCTYGTSMMVNVNLEVRNNKMLMIGYTHNGDKHFNNIQADDYFILIGRIKKYRLARACVGAGLSYGFDNVELQTTYPYLPMKKPHIGIQIEGKMYFTPIKYAGIGLGIYTNINYNSTFGGIVVSVALGKIK